MENEISYILVRAKRKSLRISINKQGQVVVNAPFFLPQVAIDLFLRERATWISSSQLKISRQTQVPKAANVQELSRHKLVAKRKILERIDFYNQGKRFFIKNISIKNMTSRWGSCSAQANLNFNYRLIYLPDDLLDYVVVHELCHLIEHNHGKSFWFEVSKIMPDYKLLENKLKKYSLC
jgi:predicted metal-dependent hydrolase